MEEVMKNRKKKTKKVLGCISVIIVCLFLGALSIKYFHVSVINEIFIKYDGIIEMMEMLLTGVSLMSILILIKQIKGDHEKGRREKAIELSLSWTTLISRETNAAKKIVEKFNADQCRKLFFEEEFKIDCALYDEIIETLNEKPFKQDKCEGCENKRKEKDCDCLLSLNRRQAKKLRWHVICYLNLLESILVSWQYSIADREIIEQELSFLVSPKERRNVLEDFRIAAGSEESYPAIEIFCNHLENKRKEKLKEKGNIF